jgi:hypothetical protein
MRNILSYQNGKFTGQEIMDWAKYQVENETSHKDAGRYILNHFNLIPYNTYTVRSSYSGTGCGTIIHKPIVLRV